MTRISLCTGLCVVLIGSGVRAEKKYTIADLEALARNSSWQELVQHLEDVPPAQRDKKWQAVVEKGAIGSLKDFKADRDPLAGLFYADGLSKRYRFLKTSKAFMALRTEEGMKGFAACFDRSYERCDERLLPFVEADPGNFDLAVRAAELMMRKRNHYFAVPYYKLALDRGKSKVCSAKRLDEAVVSALGLPAKERALVAPAVTLAETCYAQVKGALLKGSFGDRTYKANVCPILKKKAPKKDQCGE